MKKILRILCHSANKATYLFYSAIIIGGIFILFKIGANENIIGIYITTTVALIGYFLTHELENRRNAKMKKFELCLELIKSLRFLLLEPYNSDNRKKELRDKFIDAYYAFSLLISAKAYQKLQDTRESLEAFMKDQDKEKFQNVQSAFINHVRQEFGIYDEIDFKTYVIPVANDEKASLTEESKK